MQRRHRIDATVSERRASERVRLVRLCVYVCCKSAETASARGDDCSPAKVMTTNCSHSGIRASSHAASCRRRADLPLRIVNPATPPFKQRLVRARRVKCARKTFESSVSADTQNLPQVRTLGRVVQAPDRSALCCPSLFINLSPSIQCAQATQSGT